MSTSEQTSASKRAIECTLSNAELIEAVDKWNSDLCQRRRTWTMSIPARPNEDVDLLIGEMSYRFRQLTQGQPDEMSKAQARIRELEAAVWVLLHHVPDTEDFEPIRAKCKAALNNAQGAPGL